jgi:hypothetical protein
MKTKVKGYKGFDKNMQCRGFQYKVGGKYKEDEVSICEKGFHFCENPLDVFGYYGPADSRYAEVEGGGKMERHDSDSKIVCSELHIKDEIGLTGLIQAGVKFILDRVKWEGAKESNIGYRSAATNTGCQSVATNTGNYSAATNTGDFSVATNTGDFSVATNTGYRSVATNTGCQSAATNTGDQSVAINISHYSTATNTGDQSVATNTGYRSVATNTGCQSVATNTGDFSVATNTGYRSAATNTGDQSVATNIGYHSTAANTGCRSTATNIGYQSVASVEGKESVAMAIGYESKAKGALGCWIVLSEWEGINGEYHIKDVQCAKVDGKKIKADTYYRLRNGEFVEAE